MTMGTAKALWVEIRGTYSASRMKAGLVGVEGEKGEWWEQRSERRLGDV